jgi:hypothetical protein
MLKRTAGQRSTKEILKKRLKMFEKLIQLIAQGIDCQEIFDLVILNSSDSDCDVRVKKMLYFYFEECRDCDLVILAINTLQKGSFDDYRVICIAPVIKREDDYCFRRFFLSCVLVCSFDRRRIIGSDRS